MNQTETIERQGFGYEPSSWELDLDKEIEEWETNLKKNKLIIEEICDAWSPATNSYALLYLEFLKTKFESIEVTSGKDNLIFKIPKKLARRLTSPESVGRAFRVLNSKGKCLPTNEAVFLKRMIRQKALRQYFGEKFK